MRDVGRPAYLFQDVPIKDIIPIMLQHGMNGGFFQTLPSEIYKHTNHLMSLSSLDKIDDPDFLRAKSVAISASFDYWTQQMYMATIPPVAWIWISKNLGRWRDDRNISIDLPDPKKIPSKEEAEQRKLQLRLMLQEVAR